MSLENNEKDNISMLLENNEKDKKAWKEREEEIRRNLIIMWIAGVALILLGICFRTYICSFLVGVVDFVASLVTIIDYIEKKEQEDK